MENNNDDKKTVQKSSKATAGAKKDEPVMVMVEALKTPVITEKAKLAKGGRVPMDQATAEIKQKAGEVTIIRVID